MLSRAAESGAGPWGRERTRRDAEPGCGVGSGRAGSRDVEREPTRRDAEPGCGVGSGRAGMLSRAAGSGAGTRSRSRTRTAERPNSTDENKPGPTRRAELGVGAERSEPTGRQREATEPRGVGSRDTGPEPTRWAGADTPGCGAAAGRGQPKARIAPMRTSPDRRVEPSWVSEPSDPSRPDANAKQLSRSNDRIRRNLIVKADRGPASGPNRSSMSWPWSGGCGCSSGLGDGDRLRWAHRFETSRVVWRLRLSVCVVSGYWAL